MSNEKDPSPEDILKEELQKAEEAGKNIASEGRDITQVGQSIADLAKATFDIAEIVPDALNIESQIDFWQDINAHSATVLRHLGDAQEFLYTLSGTSSTATSDVIASTALVGQAYPFISPEKVEPARQAVDYFGLVVSRLGLKEEVNALLIKWGFDKGSPGNVSPAELYMIAYEAYERPVSDTNPVSTSLIPMRECINAVIAELLRRRPRQEKTKKNFNKILSIGTQLKRNEISDEVVQDWAMQGDRLINDLSSAKQGAIAREECGRQLQLSTLFLHALLNGLDPSKLRGLKD